MKVFLCGKGKAAQAILRRKVDVKGYTFAVFTEPGNEMVQTAAELDVLCTTADVNDLTLWPFTPDIIASVGYLRIIKPHVIDRARVINCHYSLLPNHRGRSCVPWAILDGDTVTGITYHWIDQGIDTGRVLLQAAAQIDEDETQATLFDKLHLLAADYWDMALHLAHCGYPGVQQRGISQYHRAGPPHNGVIDPAWSTEYIERFVRAMVFPPMRYAQVYGAEVRTMAEYRELMQEAAFGMVLM